MSDSPPSLFDDIQTSEDIPPKSTRSDFPQQKVFISGDLSGFHVPEQALKQRGQIPPFWRGFLFAAACGFLMLFLVVLIGLSIDEDEIRMSETVLISDGSQTNYSHVSMLPNSECYDTDIRLHNSDAYMYVDCWSSISNRYPIIFQRNVETTQFYDGDENTTFTLPFEYSVGAELRFEVWTRWKDDSVFTDHIFDGENTSFIVELPHGTLTHSLRADLVVTEVDGSSEYHSFQRSDDCHYSGSRCTLEVYYETEEGFWDSATNLYVLNLTSPLENGAELELVYWDYSGEDDGFFLLFFWLPPIIYIIGVAMMFINKRNQMGVGALVGLIPTFPATLILSIIIGEFMYY